LRRKQKKILKDNNEQIKILLDYCFKEMLKIVIASKNEKEGIINISTGFTIFSAGGEGVIEVKSVPDTNETTVAIGIKPKMKAVLIDWGASFTRSKADIQ
ncbi:unnamed protein product, partial [marine sediment metagenome]